MAAESNSGEIPLHQLLNKLMDNSAYHDITLEGTDGTKVTANRNILAARSQFFETLLKGDFQEARMNRTDGDIIPVAFEGCILRAVVQYLHTDDVDLLAPLLVLQIEFNQAVAEAILACLAVATAAHYFKLPGLSHRTQEYFLSYMGKASAGCAVSVSLLVLEGLFHHGFDSVPEAIRNIAFSQVSYNPSNCVDCPEALEIVSDAVVRLILDPKKIGMPYDWHKFNLIRTWAGLSSDEPFSEETQKGRKGIAMELVKDYVDLRKLEKGTLDDVVVPTGLADPERLDAAYKYVAKIWNPIKHLQECYNTNDKVDIE